MSKHFVDMGALKAEIRALCESRGLPGVDVVFSDNRRGIYVEMHQRLDIDPTEESNAVVWENN